MVGETHSPTIFASTREITVTESISRSAAFRLEADDYIAANRLHTRMKWRSLPALGSFLCFILGYAVFLYGSWRAPPNAPLVMFVTFVVICGIVIPPLSYLLYLPYKTRKVFREQKNLHYPMTVSWSETGFKVENQQGNATMPWTDFFKWSEDGRILLLYHSSRLFRMLPKRALTEAQLADMRQFITAPRM